MFVTFRKWFNLLFIHIQYYTIEQKNAKKQKQKPKQNINFTEKAAKQN